MRFDLKRWINGAVFLLGVGWILWDMPFIVWALPTDFEYYYEAAEQLAERNTTPNKNDIYYNWMAESVREGIGSWYLYPPYFAGALAPLTALGHRNAKTIFAGLCAVALIGIDLLLLRLRKRAFPELAEIDLLIHGLVFFAAPTRLILGSLQIEGALFCLFLLTLSVIIDRKKTRWAGAAFVPGVLIKLWPGPYLVSLLAVEGRTILYPIVAAVAAAVILFTLFFGASVQWTYCQSILPILIHYADPYKDNQSLTIFLLNVGGWNDALIRILRWIVLFSYFAATFRNRKFLQEREISAILSNACLFLTVSLLVTPTAWSAAHIRLLLPTIAACGFCVEEGRRKWLLAPTGIALLFYMYPQEIGKKILPLWIDRYPLLYATLFLYGVFLVFNTCFIRKGDSNAVNDSI